MVDELRAQFLPKFVAETRARLRTAIALIPPVGPGGPESAMTIAAMMESITGEAMHMDLPSLALLGRAAAAAARRYLEIRSDAALVACARTLRSFMRAVEELASMAEPASSVVTAITGESPPVDRYRILIVDDSPLNAALMREVLMNQGFEASTACDDFELVLQRLKELQPHVLLVDWLMPGCDTRKLCRHVRTTPEFSQIRVLLITSVPQQEAARLATSMGIDGALSKEQGASAIVDKVRAVLKEPR